MWFCCWLFFSFSFRIVCYQPSGGNDESEFNVGLSDVLGDSASSEGGNIMDTWRAATDSKSIFSSGVCVHVLSLADCSTSSFEGGVFFMSGLNAHLAMVTNLDIKDYDGIQAAS